MVDLSNYSCDKCKREFTRHCKNCLHTSSEVPTKFKPKKKVEGMDTISLPFPPHKVTLKTISKGLLFPSPSRALGYILERFENVVVTVNKQMARSIAIQIHCSDNQYELIKLYFIKDMGSDFIWKD